MESSEKKSFFPLNVNYALFGIGVLQKLFWTQKDISLEVIQNGCKSNRVLQASIEVSHQISGGWEGQIMWNLQKYVWCIQRSMFY